MSILRVALRIHVSMDENIFEEVKRIIEEADPGTTVVKVLPHPLNDETEEGEEAPRG